MADMDQGILQEVLQKYPVLQKYGFQVGRAEGPHLGPLEFFHPNEGRSPRPGVPYIELYNRDYEGRQFELSPEHLRNAIFGDALHYLPSVDERFRGLREEFRNSITPEQRVQSRRRYNYYRENFGEKRPYDDWFELSDLDQFLGGYLAPGERDEWAGSYTDKQKFILEAMRAYLEGR